MLHLRTDDPLIRPARPEDAAEAAQLVAASICALCQRDHANDPSIVARWAANKTPGQMRRWITDGPLSLTVAHRAGRMVGVGATSGPDEIALVHVAPEARFTGVSAALLAVMEARLRQAGAVRLRAVSTLTARPFFLARGWLDLGDPVENFGLTGFPMAKEAVPF